MKAWLFALILSLGLSTSALAFETGKWLAKNGEWEAEIAIKKASGRYHASFLMCAQSRPNVNACYKVDNAEARLHGKNLQIKVDNKVGIEIEPDMGGIKVYTDFTKVKFAVEGDKPEMLVNNSELNNILLSMKWQKR